MPDRQPSNPAERTPSDPTLPASKSPDAFGGGTPTIVGAASAHPGLGSSQFNPSVEVQNLLTDALLFSAPRVALDGVERPVLGGIHLIAKLGQGGMGAVYYGINPRLETELAVKILPLTTAQNGKDLVERFVREARIAARVRSPHIAAVYDVNVENGVFYIQMEFISGKSAGAYMRELLSSTGKGMNESAALDICIAAADGLSAAHAEGIIHRDIKPDNIMLPRRRARASETGMSGAGDAGVLDFSAAKLLDLGLARRLQTFGDKDLTLQDTGMGTPGYMPPEQAQDAHSARETADVYSLGATLYALLAGHAPFRGTTPLNVAMATIQKPHEPIENTRNDLNTKTRELLHACLQKDPAQRPSNGTELLAAMRACRRAMGDSTPFTPKPKSAVVQPSVAPPPAAAREVRNTPRPIATPQPPMTPRPAAPAVPVALQRSSAAVRKPSSDAEMAFAELIGSSQAAAKSKRAKPGSRWLVIVAACMFFLFVIGAIALLFILIAYSGPDDQKNDNVYSPAPNPASDDSNDTNSFNNSKNAANQPAETIHPIFPPWDGTVTDIKAYPTLMVKVGDPILSIRGDKEVGRGREIFSPLEGEIEEVFVAKGARVTTTTTVVTIKVKH